MKLFCYTISIIKNNNNANTNNVSNNIKDINDIKDIGDINVINDIYKLKNIDKTNCPQLYTMKGKTKYCKIIDVYDGDTCNIVFDNNNELQQYRLRLYGINCKELKPSNKIDNREEYIECAKNAKYYLESLILNKICYIEFVKEEKYGRLMGTIYLDSSKTINVNELMIKNGHAESYII